LRTHPLSLVVIPRQLFPQFKDRYLSLKVETPSGQAGPIVKRQLSTLLRELSDDEDDASIDNGPATPEDPSRPWLRDFRAYLDTVEHVPEGWSTISYPVALRPDGVYHQTARISLTRGPKSKKISDPASGTSGGHLLLLPQERYKHSSGGGGGGGGGARYHQVPMLLSQ
jgi:hypothetical protein